MSTFKDKILEDLKSPSVRESLRVRGLKVAHMEYGDSWLMWPVSEAPSIPNMTPGCVRVSVIDVIRVTQDGMLVLSLDGAIDRDKDCIVMGPAWWYSEVVILLTGVQP